MYTVEHARQIWKGTDMSDDDLTEWIEMMNQREHEMLLDEEDKGETIEVRLVSHSNK